MAAGGDELDVFEGLASLIDNSLLRQDETEEGEPRFAMLEIIREYGLDRLAGSAEKFDVRARHVSFFAALAEQSEVEIRGPQQGMWYRQLDLEHSNLRAALDFCAKNPALVETGLRMGGALWWFWWRRAHQREGSERLERLLAAAGDGKPSVGRAKALCGAGGLAFFIGKAELSRQRLEQSVQVARELGDDALVAVGLIHLSWPLLRLDLALARKAVEEGLAMFREAGDAWGIATALNYLGELMRVLGNLPEAAKLYEESVALNREIGNTWVLATSTHNLACALRRLGTMDRVPALTQESALAVRQIPSPTLATMVLQDMADLAMHQGEPARATRLVGAATAIFDDIGCVIEDADRLEFDRITALAREMLSPDAYTRAWSEGTSMTRAEAMAYAIHEEHTDAPGT